MRMWHQSLIPLLCNKHLLGMHGEIHKFRHNFVKGHSIAGRISPVIQIEPLQMGISHDLCAKEMVSRGMNHTSPYVMPDLSHYPQRDINRRVCLEENVEALNNRCAACAVQITKERSL